MQSYMKENQTFVTRTRQTGIHYLLFVITKISLQFFNKVNYRRPIKKSKNKHFS